MGRIAEKKKELILERAKKVFLEKGFANVTMKDIIEACGISRGGLYLYYSSTREIFLTIFRRDAQLTADAADIAIWEEQTATDILFGVFDVYKKTMRGDGPTMAHAIYEFFMENPDERIVKQWQFDGLVETVREVLIYGIARGEFNEMDTAIWSKQIALFLEGLTLNMPLIGMKEAEIDHQLELLVSPIISAGAPFSAYQRPGNLFD
ncbi:TetR/AcrR family transcriptional regulator [Pseudoramibacter faecis]|uniref:TetR/AcrR family transcriptional regulator n=1 Tax=Pseudoramibacter faecis TaxID=3108534 RepID=UPI002E780E3D|nr:TetR/AcrR family transcriptional regulator [Pseudoramibacter sp. HA2172]